jgi:hypothetical protein
MFQGLLFHIHLINICSSTIHTFHILHDGIIAATDSPLFCDLARNSQRSFIDARHRLSIPNYPLSFRRSWSASVFSAALADAGTKRKYPPRLLQVDGFRIIGVSLPLQNRLMFHSYSRAHTLPEQASGAISASVCDHRHSILSFGCGSQLRFGIGIVVPSGTLDKSESDKTHSQNCGREES